MLDLPRFFVMRYDAEMDLWTLMSSKATYAEANSDFVYYRGKGYSGVYLIGASFIRGPGDEDEL